MESGMIGDKEVEMHRLAKFVWAIDIIKHTSEDTKELVYGWVVGDEQKAHDLYHEKVNELKGRGTQGDTRRVCTGKVRHQS